MQTPTRPLFPRLRILQWPIPGVRFGDQEFIFLFFGPHINEIDLRAVSLDPYKKTINLMKECCPALSSFSFTCEPFPELRDLFRGWESLRTLKCAGFPHHGKMWTLPILLPNLETLHLGITGLGAAQTKPAGTSMMKYASLRNLTLATMYQSIEHVNDLLSMLSFPRPESLSISICTVIYPTHISVESLFDSDTVARICSFDALQKVEVTLGGDYYNACSIHSLTLQPLLSFFKMQTLNITAFCFMDLDDEFLEDISHAWKSIVSLCLQPDSRLWLRQSQITLRGLEHLSQHCPRLEQFAAVISAYIPPGLPASDIASTTNNEKEPCNLVSLSLTNSTITSPYDVAVFLCSQFPRLVCISSEWKRNDDPESIANREQWARVQELVRELWRKDQ